MRYPKLRQQPTHRDTVDSFGGYNHNLRIGPGEFYDMRNLSSDCYPVLSPRPKRGHYATGGAITGLIAKEQLCYTDGADFVIGTDRYPMGLDERPKQLISMGAWVIILPDRKYINTVSPGDRGDIEAECTTAGEVSCHICSAEGEIYEPLSQPPDQPETGQLWLDTSGENPVLKRFATDQWLQISPYIRIASPGLGTNFRVRDGIELRGLGELDGRYTLQGVGEDHIVIPGILTQPRTCATPVTISRKLPQMDFVVESGNRLWGCRYGPGPDGGHLNEIYASRLGDFRNWHCFDGLSTDSYTASCGSDGPFTGAVTYLGSPIFFKEGCMHRVYGNYPANFRIQTTACRGVRKGSSGSLAIVGENLYYQSPAGICAFDGSIPVEASYPLGPDPFFRAVAGSIGNKYYISMADGEGNYHLFVHDTARNLWHREDELRVDAFAAVGGELYALEHGTGRILTLLGSGEPCEAELTWMAQTGGIGITTPDMQYVSRLTVRLSLDVGTEVRFYARYDFSEEWEPLFALRSSDLRSFSIPIKTRRCDHMYLRIEGDGGARIYAMTKCIEEGSDIS